MKNRIAILFCCSVSFLLIACSSLEKDEKSLDVKDEEMFATTTRCVNLKLPEQIRSTLNGKPSLLSGPNFDTKSVDKIVNELDSSVANLLRTAMRNAWRSVPSSQPAWSGSFYSALEREYAAEIAENAPEFLSITSCGNGDQVGSSALAAISMYFSRSVRDEKGYPPQWLESLGVPAKDKGASIIMLAAGLRLAGVSFDAKELAESAGR